MFHRESGVFKTSYAADMALYPLPIAKWAVAAFAGLFIVIAPLTLGEYYISILNLILIACVGDLGRRAGLDPGAASDRVRYAAKDAGAALSVPDVLRRAGDRRHREPDPQPDRPRFRRHPRPGHRRRDHRYQHLPLQAVGFRDLVFLRGGHRRALHLLPGHRELRAVPADGVDRLPGDGDHRRSRIDPRLDLGG